MWQNQVIWHKLDDMPPKAQIASPPVAAIAASPGTPGRQHRQQTHCLPSAEDRAFVSLMQRITEPGKMAGWLAPPEIGINSAPLDYEYMRVN
jgi:hypothetical protein